MKLGLGRIQSPLGEIVIVTDRDYCIRALDFSDREARCRRLLLEHHPESELEETGVPRLISDALRAYFAADFTALNSLAIEPAGTERERAVWTALRNIPAGQTTSYGNLARALGFLDPRMAVEIGAAAGANPIAIINPCHRLIAKNGALGGFAWGLHRKRWLLRHEGVAIPTAKPARIPTTLTLPGF